MYATMPKKKQHETPEKSKYKGVYVCVSAIAGNKIGMLSRRSRYSDDAKHITFAVLYMAHEKDFVTAYIQNSCHKSYDNQISQA